MHTCEVCKAKVSELRRGRCWGCYARWVDARPVGVGARCVVCGEQRRRVLKLIELLGSWHPTCFNCAGQLIHFDPVPASLEALREALSRERRRLERRVGQPDTRELRAERRVGERRAAPGAGWLDDEEDVIVEVVIDPAPPGVDLDGEGITGIREQALLAELVDDDDAALDLDVGSQLAAG